MERHLHVSVTVSDGVDAHTAPCSATVGVAPEEVSTQLATLLDLAVRNVGGHFDLETLPHTHYDPNGPELLRTLDELWNTYGVGGHGTPSERVREIVEHIARGRADAPAPKTELDTIVRDRLRQCLSFIPHEPDSPIDWWMTADTLSANDLDLLLANVVRRLDELAAQAGEVKQIAASLPADAEYLDPSRSYSLREKIVALKISHDGYKVVAESRAAELAELKGLVDRLHPEGANTPGLLVRSRLDRLLTELEQARADEVSSDVRHKIHQFIDRFHPAGWAPPEWDDKTEDEPERELNPETVSDLVRALTLKLRHAQRDLGRARKGRKKANAEVERLRPELATGIRKLKADQPGSVFPDARTAVPQVATMAEFGKPNTGPRRQVPVSLVSPAHRPGEGFTLPAVADEVVTREWHAMLGFTPDPVQAAHCVTSRHDLRVEVMLPGGAREFRRVYRNASVPPPAVVQAVRGWDHRTGKPMELFVRDLIGEKGQAPGWRTHAYGNDLVIPAVDLSWKELLECCTEVFDCTHELARHYQAGRLDHQPGGAGKIGVSPLCSNIASVVFDAAEDSQAGDDAVERHVFALASASVPVRVWPVERIP